MKIMQTFYDLLRESVIFQGLITIIVLGVWAYLLISGRPIPDTVQLLSGTVVGFFFGGKYAQAVSRTADTVSRNMTGR